MSKVIARLAALFALFLVPARMTMRCTVARATRIGAALGFMLVIANILSAHHAFAQTCIPAPSGLLAWWPFDSSLNDISGNGHNPISTSGTSLVPAEVLNGVTYVGGSSTTPPPVAWIDISQGTLTPPQFTVDAWVNPIGPGPNNDSWGSVIVEKAINGTNSTVFLAWRNDYRFRFGGGNITTFMTSPPFPPGTFYHVVGTYDGVTYRLYVNGTLRGSYAGTPPGYVNYPWVLGSEPLPWRAGAYKRTFNGIIDEVEIFDHALSPSEIQALFNAGPKGKCKPRLNVTKTVANPANVALPAHLNFPLDVNCAGGPNLTGLPLSDNSPQPVNNIPLGSSCTINETIPTLPPGTIPPNCHWATTMQYDGAAQPGTLPYTITNIVAQDNPHTVELINTLTCDAASLTVTKHVVNNTPVAIPPGITYPVTVTCGSAATNLTLVDNVPQTVSNIPAGTTSCGLQETLPSPPKICRAGLVPVWSTTYTPSNPVTVTGSPVNVTVTNTLNCVNSGSLNVTKYVRGDNLYLGNTLSYFTLSVTCTTPTGAVINQNTSGGVGGQPPTGHLPPVTGLPVGSTCMIQETTLPTLPNGCTWLEPHFGPPSLPLTITTGSNNVIVLNTYKCDATLKVTKQVRPDPRGIGSTLHFPIGVACTGIPPHTTSITGNSTASLAVIDGQCSITETQPSLPAGCTWLPAQFAPHAQPMTIVPGTNLLTITNGYTCGPEYPIGKPTTACRRPMVPGPVAGVCICPPGTVQKGRECVRPIACKPPMIANPAATACVCPPGTVQKGRECVRPIECRKPMIANRTGTECICPPPMQQKGRECVAPGRPNVDGPRGNPRGDIRNGFPVGPRGGSQGPADLSGRR